MSVDVNEAWSTLRAQIDAHRPGAENSIDSRVWTIPVTLLTGFLGAGKSTLLAHALQNPNGLRIRALVNDVGSLPFDPTLVGVADDVRVELTNGCGCCTNTSDIASALNDLAREAQCDLIVLEASGASDPSVLAHVVHGHPLLHLDRVVTVVDASALLSDENNTWTNNALRQHLAVADCIIVSGADALFGDDVDRVVKQASQLAPGRTVEMSGLYEPASHVLMPGALRGTHLSMGTDEGHHVNTYVTSVSQQNVLTKQDLVQALEDARPGLVRAKGRLILDGSYWLVQVSGHSVDVRETESGPTSITLISELEDDVRELRTLIQRSAS